MVRVYKNIKNVKVNDKWTLLLQDIPKTEKSNRYVSVPKNVLSQLEIHKKKQIELKSKAESLYTNNNLIFATDFGTYISFKFK